MSTPDQWAGLANDLDGNGTGNTALTNPMPGYGCQMTDHDSNPATPDQPTCIGYELINDLNFAGRNYRPISWVCDQHSVSDPFTGDIKGNGYRILNPRHYNVGCGNAALFKRLHGKIEGVGIVSPYFVGNDWSAGFATKLSGTIEGSYVYNPSSTSGILGNYSGMIAGNIWGPGRVVNSFARGYHNQHSGHWQHPGQNAGGLVAVWNRDNAQVASTCRNSYFSGVINHRGGGDGLLAREIRGAFPRSFNIQNCVADTTTDSGTSVVWGGAGSTNNQLYGRTYAQMIAPTGYDMPANNPFENWNTDANGDPEDVWDFGDETELPVLKGYGHDRTFPRARAQRFGQDPAHTVNLCERTLAVANEVIRQLQNDQWRQNADITEVPSEVASLEPCEESTDTRSVLVDHLRDFVVTSEDNPFRLDPERVPGDDPLTALHVDDLAYLQNARHWDFSGNSLTTLPNRIFQGVGLSQLNLSDNAITSLPPDIWADRVNPTAVQRTNEFMWLNLDGNRLTASGLPDRIFDDISYMNGLTMRSNSLAGINTRWFERMGNLGHRPPADHNIYANLGLHIEGNPLTEHYYQQRAFGDMKFDQTEYTGENPGAALLTAITARMTAFGTDTTNLRLSVTDYLTGGALRANGCPVGQTQGPPGALDIYGDPVQCEFSVRWTPPLLQGIVTTALATAPAAVTGQGSIRITFTHTSEPMVEMGMTASPVTGYQIRFRPRPDDASEPWTQQWRSAPVDITTDGEKTLIIERLEADTVYQFQMRTTSLAGPGPASSFSQGTRLRLPVVKTIKPTIREISVQAGQQVRLEVDVYSRQDTVRNDLADADGAKVVFQWSESPSGGGSFGSPSTDRRVVYTAPSLPGTYTVLAEVQPEGACTSHHTARFGLTEAARADCIATFTIRVSRAPGTPDPPPEPVNPAGLIPSSLTDNDGVAYAVFTPVQGGTFTGEGITVTTIKGAVPDGQLLGVSATASSIPVPAPIPGARMTLAGSYYEVNGVQRNGEAPVSGYMLDDPISACLPLPDMFRSDISDVVVVNRNPSDGTLGILSSKVRQTDSGLVICGSIGTLPATVAAARLGIVEATPEPPQEPGIEDLSVGAVTPGLSAAVWAMVIGAMMLASVAGISIFRRRQPIVPVGTLREASAAPSRHLADC